MTFCELFADYEILRTPLYREERIEKFQIKEFVNKFGRKSKKVKQQETETDEMFV